MSHPERPDRHEDDVLRHLSTEFYAQRRRPEHRATPPPAERPPLVTVAVDGSAGSVAAVDQAATEASMRGWELRLIHVVQPADGDAASTAHDEGTALLARLADQARQRTSTPVSVELRAGSVVDVLVEHAARPGLLFLGSRGMGALKQIAAGSVSTRVAAGARSPIVVVPPSAAPPDPGFRLPVVVGVDGSAESSAAAEFAAEEARLRGVALTALHAAASPSEPDVLNTGALDPARHAGLSVERRSVTDRAAEALIDASTTASAVVVGTRGGGIRGVRLGSTSQALLRHARCPVVVVPSRATHR